jgi:hypothetical protein
MLRDSYRGWTFKQERSLDVLHDDGESHQHDSRGYTTENETKKPKSRAIGNHDTSLSLSLVVGRARDAFGSSAPCQRARAASGSSGR